MSASAVQGHLRGHLRRMRAADVVGTFDENAFQCRFDGTDNGEALSVPVTPMGHLCVPLLGTYLQEYDPVIPTVLLQSSYRPDKVPEEGACLLCVPVPLLTNKRAQWLGR